MAVRAAHFAFCDLSFDCRPRVPASRDESDSLTLHGSIDVIEFEDQRICFTTIGAGVGEQVRP
jgi:hypothetical protein